LGETSSNLVTLVDTVIIRIKSDHYFRESVSGLYHPHEEKKMLTTRQMTCVFTSGRSQQQGCQMAHFQKQKSKFGYFLESLAMEDLEYFMTIWSILQPSGILYGHFEEIRYIFPVCVCYTKKNLATILSSFARYFLPSFPGSG
jgi:hypothetical protein